MSQVTAELHHKISQFLYQEARFLDDEEWDNWLECYMTPRHLFGCQRGTMMTRLSPTPAPRFP